MVTSVKNTETIGLWTEMILCRIHNITFNTTRDYIQDLSFDIENDFMRCLSQVTENLKFKEHIGNNNGIYDFLLDEQKTVSVKTNITGDKCCPPKIGQTTISKMKFSDTNSFKNWVLSEPKEVFDLYSTSLFDSDYTIYINFSKGHVFLIPKQYLNLQDIKFSFTKTIDTWKESCTLKMNGKAIAEIQVHNNRNSIKYRFCMTKLLELYDTKCDTFTKADFKIQKNIGTFNYIGSKTRLLSFLRDNIESYIGKPIKDISSFYDLFTGTGVVTSYFIENGCKNVTTNDNMYYSYILSSCLSKKNIDISKISSVIDTLNNISPIPGYITDTYSGKRLYFTSENASKIDSIRSKIESDKESFTIDEYNILIKILLYSSSKVANISSTYGAFLKKFKKSSTNVLKMEKTVLKTLFEDNTQIKSFNSDVLKLVSEIDISGDVCYLDPPYNSRKYSSNYFVMEVIAKYNKKPVSNGITGVSLEEPCGSSSFCSKSTALSSFNQLFSKIKTKYIFMSYNSESLLSKSDIIKILTDNNWSNIKVIEEDYKRFKSNSKTNQLNPLYEYLFCATKI